MARIQWYEAFDLGHWSVPYEAEQRKDDVVGSCMQYKYIARFDIYLAVKDDKREDKLGLTTVRRDFLLVSDYSVPTPHG